MDRADSERPVNRECGQVAWIERMHDQLVVDAPQWQGHGLDGSRVADESVKRSHACADTNAATGMIGERVKFHFP
jgi:GMC oxidoreductase